LVVLFEKLCLLSSLYSWHESKWWFSYNWELAIRTGNREQGTGNREWRTLL